MGTFYDMREKGCVACPVGVKCESRNGLFNAKIDDGYVGWWKRNVSAVVSNMSNETQNLM